MRQKPAPVLKNQDRNAAWYCLIFLGLPEFIYPVANSIGSFLSIELSTNMLLMILKCIANIRG